jgi:ADP-heptose:LPS heptosyltransferase
MNFKKTRFFLWMLYLKSIRHLISICYLIFDTLVAFILPKNHSVSSKVLLIRLDNIGDYVIWAGQASSIRKLYPKDQYELVLLGNDQWSSLAASNDNFDEVWSVNRNLFLKSPSYRFQVFKKLRKYKFQVIINFQFSRELWVGDEIVRIGFSDKKTGHLGDLANISVLERFIGNFWYDELIRLNDSAVTEFERNVKFICKIGGSPSLRLANFTLDDEVDLLTGELENYFVLFPGASWDGRRWPANHFSELAALLQEKGMVGVICGSIKEQGIAREINHALNSPILDLTGMTSLQTLITVIRRGAVLISNETSAAHIGAATGTPTVCIIGGGHFDRFLPYKGLKNPPPMRMAYVKMDCYGCNWNCTQGYSGVGPVPCIDKITIAQVMREVDSLLDSKLYRLTEIHA